MTVITASGKQIDADTETWAAAAAVARMSNVYAERQALVQIERINFMKAEKIRELLKLYRDELCK